MLSHETKTVEILNSQIANHIFHCILIRKPNNTFIYFTPRKNNNSSDHSRKSHALLNLTTLDDVLSHSVVGASWEGFVVENLVSCLPTGVSPWFYRTSAGAEIDLVIEKSDKERYAIEIKRSRAPSVSRGFHIGCEDIKASKRFIVYPGMEVFQVTKEIMAIPILNMMKELRGIK